MDAVIPDVVLAEYAKSRLDYSDLQQEVRGIFFAKNGENSELIQYFQKALGKGGFAEVWKGKYNGKSVAIKKLLIQQNEVEKKDKVNAMTEFRQEVEIHIGFDHPNIVKLEGICINPMCMVLEVSARTWHTKILILEALRKWKRHATHYGLQH